MVRSPFRTAMRFAVLAAVLLLTSCGKEPDESSTAAKAPATPASGETAGVETPADALVEVPESAISAALLANWTGDLDGMIERRVIRVLTTYSKTMFFIDQGTPRGLVPDTFKLF